MITLVPLSGFLGSGKTTTLISAAIAMQRTGRRVAVVTNDPGSGLVDTDLARAGLDQVAEVAGGCYCRRSDELATLVARLAESGRVDTVLAEASGSCAGLRTALVRPLRRVLGDAVHVAPLTAIVDPLRLAAFARVADRCGREYELAYLFGRQLAEADLLAINKTDLIGAERTAKLEARLGSEHPHAAVVPYSATTGAGLDDLVRAWSRGGAAPEHDVEDGYPTLDLDYARYAEAEAKLAWLNQAFPVEAVGETFDAFIWARTVLRHLSDWSATAGYFVGHAKVSVRTPAGLAKLSVTEPGILPRSDRTAARPVERGSATVNARIACPPSVLDSAVCAAIAAADAVSRAHSDAPVPASFRFAHTLPPHPALADQDVSALRLTAR